MDQKPNTAELGTKPKAAEVLAPMKRRLRIPLLIGCVVFISGIVWVLATAVFVLRATTTAGVVVAIEQGDGSAWYSTFTFVDAAGIAHKQRTWFLSPTTCPASRPGDAVTVLYNAHSPEDAKIDSFPTVWFGPLFVAGVGSFFVGGAAAAIALLRHVARIHEANVAAQ